MKSHRSCGHAVVEWVLCVPVLIALAALLFGVLWLALEQIQLQELCSRAAQWLAISDDSSPLEQQAARFVRAHAAFAVSIATDRHAVAEKSLRGPEIRPSIEIVGIELSRTPLRFPGLRLRAYARAARIR